MARESQGLQIALIVTVMLAIILGVTTFIFYRQYGEAELRADAERKEASVQRQAASTTITENMELRRQMGFPEMDLDEVSEEFNQDMRTYGGNFPEDKRSYHDVLGFLYQTIQDKDAELDALKTEVQKLKDDYEVREASKDPQIKQYQAAATEAQQQLASAMSTFKTDLERITKDQASIQKQLEDARKQSAAELAAAEEKLNQAGRRIQNLSTLYKRKSQQLLEETAETFEVPDGEIRWVNQRNGTVWIDLGRADALGRQTNFSVYPVDISNLAKTGKKGSIEVTQILGEHLAEARVVEDVITDPIMPGDKIHTPVWSPGEQKRFALTGFMDLDEDGESDQQIVRRLIEINGGVVDCWSDEKGKIHGKMTIDTRYLVRGADPSETLGLVADQQANLVKGYSAMVGEADKLGIQKIPLGDLLQQMGWKHKTPVVTFGQGANPRDFRAQPADGVNRVSGGNVSALFQPRRPPAGQPSRRGGAY